LGTCNKEHSNALKQAFTGEPYEKRQRTQQKYLRRLKELSSEIDRKIERGQDRLNSKVELDKNDPEQKNKEKKVQELNENISTLLAQMEKLGEEGKVEESQALLKLVENLRKEKKEIEERPAFSNPWSGDPTTQEKRMQVCPVCAAFLVIGDAEQRVQAHLNGKLHVGYKLIRDKIEEIEKEEEEQKNAEANGTKSKAKEKEKTRSRSKSRSRSRSRDKRRDRSRDRRRSRRSRSRSRSPRRSSRRKRSRSRS